MDEFIAEQLTWRQLLALLFICECRRKKMLDTITFRDGRKPASWIEFVDRFAARLAKLPDVERAYLIGSHIQSAEEVDLYSNAEINGLLDKHLELLGILVRELESDSRFA